MTPNLNLELVSEGESPYIWSEKINSNFNIIDAHNHSEEDGVQIASSSINFRDDKKINTYLQNVSFFNFFNKLEVFTDTKNGFFAELGDLFCYDGDGNKIRITLGSSLYYGSISGTNGIAGDYVSAGAVATYNASTEKYIFEDGSENLASVTCDSFILNNVISFQSLLTESCSINANLANIDLNLPDLNLPYASFDNYPVLLNQTSVLTTSAAASEILRVYSLADLKRSTFYNGFNYAVSSNTISTNNVCFVCDMFDDSTIYIENNAYVGGTSFKILPGFTSPNQSSVSMLSLYQENVNPFSTLSEPNIVNSGSFLYTPYISIQNQGSITPLDSRYNENGDLTPQIRTSVVSKIPFGTNVISEVVFPGAEESLNNFTSYPYFLLSIGGSFAI